MNPAQNEPMPINGTDILHPEDGGDPDECRHVWRVFGWTDRCVQCGDHRPHPLTSPYTWDPYPPGGGNA